MADLETLLNNLANLDAQHDLDGLRQVREQIVAEHPETEEAVEALYKIGLDLLFRSRDLEAAIERFGQAAKMKHPFWSAAARTSLGLCYFHQRKTQKALFELRRVAYPEKPNPHSITALAFIETIFSSEGNKEEVKRVRKERSNQLEKLIDGTEHLAERGFYLYQLALARKDSGDEAGANVALDSAKALGPQALGADLYRSVVDARG